MEIILIAAVTAKGIIGNNGVRPWNYPEDLKHFKKITIGYPLIMGRKTFEYDVRKPLKGRINIILSKNPNFPIQKGISVFSKLENALDFCRSIKSEKVFISGGGEIFMLALPFADKMIITHIPDQIDGDTYFPYWNPLDWEIQGSKKLKSDLKCVTYKRKNISFS